MTNMLIAFMLKTMFVVYLCGILVFFFFFSRWSKVRKILLLALLHLVIVCGFLLYLHISLKPIISKIKSGNFYHIQNITLLRDSNNMVVGKIGHYNREYIPLHRVPKLLLQTIIAVEDEHFFSHRGLSLKNIFFNLFLGIFTNRKIVGASTITQQLAKNVFLSKEVSFRRKLREMWLALSLSKHISKEEILEIYINHIFFGEDCYGIKSAAKRFFDKNLDSLSVNEVAFLIAIIKGPSYYLKKPEKALERQDYVLRRMYQSGLITFSMYNASLNKPVYLLPKHNNYSCYSPIKEDVKKFLMNNFFNIDNGYNVYLTIHCGLQRVCSNGLNWVLAHRENSLPWRGPLGDENNNLTNYSHYETSDKKVVRMKKDGTIYNNKIRGQIRSEDMAKYGSLIPDKSVVLVEIVDKDNNRWKLVNPPVLNGAVIVIDPKTGKILAMVCGRGLEYSYVNGMHVVKSPGSVAKLIPLISALEESYPLTKELPNLPIYIGLDNSVTVITEKEIDYYMSQPGKVVKNHDTNYSVTTTLEETIVRSKNTPIIKLTELLGREKVKKTAVKMGMIGPDDPFYFSSSIGAIYTTFINTARAFAVIPNNGYKLNKIYYIERIEDINNNVIFQQDVNEIHGERIFSEHTMTTVTKVCQKVKKFGIKNKLDLLKLPWACKTGTAQNQKEATFIAWNEHHIVYVMVYSMDGATVPNLWGSTLPLDVAKYILIYLDGLTLAEEGPETIDKENKDTGD